MALSDCQFLTHAIIKSKMGGEKYIHTLSNDRKETDPVPLTQYLHYLN